ncbi:MAG: hypothetical protein WEC00_06660 [Dongiaceae bacterium]
MPGASPTGCPASPPGKGSNWFRSGPIGGPAEPVDRNLRPGTFRWVPRFLYGRASAQRSRRADPADGADDENEFCRAGRSHDADVRAAAPNAPEVERKSVETDFGSVMQGFSATFDQLDEILKTAQR